jgi:polysaccharide export outer membrane protein
MPVNIKSVLYHATLAVSLVASITLISACASHYPKLAGGAPSATKTPDYIIGPGDNVNIFVWRNPELTSTVPVRPDGKITTPLVEDVPAAGKTPTQLARDMEKALGTYVKNPVVTVIVTGFTGPYSQQIRVVGQAAHPQALSYRDRMSLLDVMIAVGGINQYASGNHATIVRMVKGHRQQFVVRIDDLLNEGDMSANVDMLPGDILIVPEAWF